MTWGAFGEANSMAHTLEFDTQNRQLYSMDGPPIGTIASVDLASPVARSILWQRGLGRERSLATEHLVYVLNPDYPEFGLQGVWGSRGSKESRPARPEPARASESGTVVDICLSFAPLGARGLFLVLEIRPKGVPLGF